MSVSCQHPHEIVYTPKAARKSFFICFSSCLLLFRLKLWKNADCALRLREQFVTSLSALFPKYYMLDEGTKGGRKWKNKQNHDSMHDFILHHFCILHYQTLHFIFATWVYKSIKFKIADFLKIIPPKRSHIWVNFNSHIFEFFMAKIDCLFWPNIAQFRTLLHCPLKKKTSSSDEMNLVNSSLHEFNEFWKLCKVSRILWQLQRLERRLQSPRWRRTCTGILAISHVWTTLTTPANNVKHATRITI